MLKQQINLEVNFHNTFWHFGVKAAAYWVMCYLQDFLFQRMRTEEWNRDWVCLAIKQALCSLTLHSEEEISFKSIACFKILKLVWIIFCHSTAAVCVHVWRG